MIELIFFFIGKLTVGSLAQISEMGQAEALAVCKPVTKFTVLSKQIEKGIKITGIGVLVLFADLAGILFFLNPHTDGIAALGGF